MSSRSKIATVGMFDGVHSGHRFLIDQLKQEGINRNLGTLVISFTQHPLAVIAPEYAPAMLSTAEERKSMILASGVDECIMLDFDRKLQQLTAREFMSMCHDSHNVDVLMLGFNNRFGSDRLSNIADYQKEGDKVGITVMQANELPDMSSSIIRNLIIDKEIKKATEKLGYFYFLEGTVVKGKQIGRTIGFPTANLQPSTDKLIPPKGVYASLVTLPDGGQRPAMLNIGCRPTVDKNNAPISIEANIFDFSGDLYDKTIKIHFLDFIREELKFNSLEELRNQIAIDKTAVQKAYDSIINNRPSL
ncbi:MAG: riboflavin biosynthesis protein RibF [Muribaculaceae bacterium]|nr:riboflavin biosynthesis protein RibF [Muribaculaceae bacterium]